MKFEHYTPSDALKPFVQSLVISESEHENSYKVLPGINLVIGFQYRGMLSVLNDGKELGLSNYGVTGLRDSPGIFKNSAGTGSVLVYFKVTGASSFFAESVHELFGQSLSLDNFILRSELLILEEQLCEADSDIKRIQLVEYFLLSRLQKPKSDPLVLAALTLIFEHNGNIRISEMAMKLNTSQSPLEKRFRKVVGASPKKFASLVRLKYTLQQFKPQMPFTDLAYGSGFYDQAHFIKEFKTLTGETPERFFGKE